MVKRSLLDRLASVVELSVKRPEKDPEIGSGVLLISSVT